MSNDCIKEVALSSQQSCEAVVLGTLDGELLGHWTQADLLANQWSGCLFQYSVVCECRIPKGIMAEKFWKWWWLSFWYAALSKMCSWHEHGFQSIWSMECWEMTNKFTPWCFPECKSFKMLLNSYDNWFSSFPPFRVISGEMPQLCYTLQASLSMCTWLMGTGP